ncbi:hypothetical protein HPB49_020020 [Dermacentor silvarum]|uniref:Uncharacterized protein n=1 Tax=Dermacentor silvarum TaxID=543639 RepID=A0ACB8E2P9_DERSI|nr:hypothetical protein HPB49_020020 [Dermacentor silvarum]
MLNIVASTFSAVSSATSAFSWKYVMLLTVTTATQRVLLATIAVAGCVVVSQGLLRFYRLWKALRPMAGPPDWFPPLFNVNCLRAAARYRDIFNTSTAARKSHNTGPWMASFLVNEIKSLMEVAYEL